MSKELYEIGLRNKTKVIGMKSCLKNNIERVFVKQSFYKKFTDTLHSKFKTVYVLEEFPTENFNYSVVGFK